MTGRHDLPERLEAFFGDTYPLVVHIVRMAIVFIILVLSIWIIRTIVDVLFVPEEGHILGLVLRIVDTYAALLGIGGFSVFISVDMFLLIRGQSKHRPENEG